MLVPRLMMDLTFDRDVPWGPPEKDCAFRRTSITAACAAPAMTTTSAIRIKPLDIEWYKRPHVIFSNAHSAVR